MEVIMIVKYKNKLGRSILLVFKEQIVTIMFVKEGLGKFPMRCFKMQPI